MHTTSTLRGDHPLRLEVPSVASFSFDAGSSAIASIHIVSA